MYSKFFRLAGCLFTVVLGGAISAEEPRSASSPIWLTICQSPSSDSQSSKFEFQVPSGIDFEVIDTIAETLSDRDIDIGRLIPRQNIKMEFSTASFVVMRIGGEDLTLAPGSDFPFDATRALATRFNGLGIQNTTIVEPDKLLQRRLSHGDPFVPEFVYDLRGQGDSQSGDPFGP